MPNAKVELHFIELLVEPDIELLDYANGETITIQPIMRYHKDGEIYSTNLLIDGSAKAEIGVYKDTESGVYTADPLNVVYGSGTFFNFTKEDGTTTNELILSPDSFVNNTPTVMRKTNLLSMGKETATNSPYFKLSNFSNGKGVNYVYNDMGTSFVEISFIVTVGGRNFEGNYGLGVSVSDIFGKILDA